MTLAESLHENTNLSFETKPDLPGQPTLVFPRKKLAIIHVPRKGKMQRRKLSTARRQLQRCGYRTMIVWREYSIKKATARIIKRAKNH